VRLWLLREGSMKDERRQKIDQFSACLKFGVGD
jgi:hypothetical protein